MHTVEDGFGDLPLVPVFELPFPVLAIRLFFCKPKVDVQMMGLILMQRTDEVYVLGVEPHIAEEFPEGALYEANALFGRVDLITHLFIERDKPVPQHFIRLRSPLYRFELFLRDNAVAVEHARRLFKVRDHVAYLRFGIFAVQFSVRGHVLVDIVSAVRHFIIRPLTFKLLSLLCRSVAF